MFPQSIFFSFLIGHFKYKCMVARASTINRDLRYFYHSIVHLDAGLLIREAQQSEYPTHICVCLCAHVHVGIERNFMNLEPTVYVRVPINGTYNYCF